MLGINFESSHEFIVFEILREELYVNSPRILSRNQILFWTKNNLRKEHRA